MLRRFWTAFLLLSGVGPLSACGDDVVKVDLARRAKVFASHATPAAEFAIENAIDGDPESKWVGESHPLSFQPTNIVLEFDAPLVVRRAVLVSQVFRERLALKDFEVYAWGEKGWAGATPLAVVRATRDIRTTVDLDPVRTARLRIRIRDTWRDDHSYPRLNEIEVYAAAGAAAPRVLKDSPIAGERNSERMLLDRAMGRLPEFPGEEFDPAKGYVYYARAMLDTMIAEGRDVYGPVHSPMFCSLLDMDTHRNPEDTPADIPGQRYGDRTLHGGNLFHDVMLLRAADSLSELTGQPKYRQAATDYLKFLFEHCRQPTGLLPWGEHAHWDFFKEGPGDPIHEYLGGVPTAFWERCWQLSPEAVRGEADGLLNHVVNLETFDFDRHADIRRPLPIPRPKGLGFLDFPRHGGFYIHLWTFVYGKTGDAKYLGWSRKMLDKHWRQRSAVSGLPPGCPARRNERTASTETMLSYSASVLEAARLLPAGADRDRYERDAKAYLESLLRLRHRPAEGRFLVSFPVDAKPEEAAGAYGEPYRYGYGGGFTADDAVLLLAVYRLTGDRRALAQAEDFAAYYRAHEPPPPTQIVRAHVYASIIGLFIDLYELTGKPEHLEQAERYARCAIRRLYNRGMFRGATGINHYEGDMMVSNLVYNLVWLHAVKAKTGVRIEPNYFNR
jgi:hypothetical protein